MNTLNKTEAAALREQVKEKYREVATAPGNEFHFHTGRFLAHKLGYAAASIAQLPEAAVESFAGVGNPFSLRALEAGEKVVDVGCGAGFDCFIAGKAVTDTGRVIGVDMTEAMLEKATANAQLLDSRNVEFRHGLLEEIPVSNAWADVVISNGVLNLCGDKRQVFAEINRILKPGGYLQFADIANSKPIPQAAMESIDLWTA